MIKNIKKIGNATLYCADCKDVFPLLEEIDACVTDPPYGLSFMGNAWDYDVPSVVIWNQVYNVLKPGSHLLSFFGSRTYHRGVIPIEDAGFEIRDQLMWLYGSGFPKSHNIGKAVDKLQGNEREDLGEYEPFGREGRKSSGKAKFGAKGWETKPKIRLTKGNSEWEGWGTALKPAHEPIVMAKKPFKGTVANNVLEHGTGGINIHECRVGDKGGTKDKPTGDGIRSNQVFGVYGSCKTVELDQGRFPANVMHDGSDSVQDLFGDKSRYFYCAKASKQDRDEGLDEFENKITQGMRSNAGPALVGDNESGRTTRKNNHPTVKPTELMRYLCRLVTPKGGVVLDPFMGSGSTGKAAVAEGFSFVGIEMNENYFDVACARIDEAYKKKSQQLF
tara:strand:+ start:510 stop:1679 length:1170 start_codon:yes stop_codon:yes gene_type:complete